MRKFLIAALLAGCRTEIQPVVKAEVPAGKSRRSDDQCYVRDYPTATEVPAGSKGLGWVKVPREQTDELTFERLRTKICELGGDALSQPRWIRAAGASVADPPIELEGNAWILP